MIAARTGCPGTPHRGHTRADDPCPLVATWVESDPDRDVDRPRYRALADPWYAADPVSGAPQLVGWELTVYRVDAYWLAAAGERGHAPLGVTQVPATVAGALVPAAARAQVADYLRLLAEPLLTRVVPSDVALYREVP